MSSRLDGSSGTPYVPNDRAFLPLEKNKNSESTTIKHARASATTSKGAEALANRKVDNSSEDTKLKSKVTVKREAADGVRLRNEMNREMHELRVTLSKCKNTKGPGVSDKLINETLDKLALLKLSIDKCDKEVAGAGRFRQIRQTIAKSLAHSTSDDARSLLKEFDRYLKPEEKKIVLEKYKVFEGEYANFSNHLKEISSREKEKYEKSTLDGKTSKNPSSVRFEKLTAAVETLESRLASQFNPFKDDPNINQLPKELTAEDLLRADIKPLIDNSKDSTRSGYIRM